MALPELVPITDAELPQFCEFLHRHLDPGKPPGSFQRALQQRWGMEPPNHGFLIRNGEGLVGGIGAIYAERELAGRRQRFCNITSWCVLEPFRSQSMRLLMALVNQPGFHFTNFTPTAVVAKSLQFLKFQPLDSDRAVLPNTPIANLAVRIETDPDIVTQVLPPPARRLFDDHRRLPWLQQLAVGRPGAFCLVVFKRKRLKGLPSAEIIAVSDRALFTRYHRAFGRHVLLRHGMVTTRIETRLLTDVPPFAKVLSGYRPKMFRSDSLAATDIDNLYSELVALDL
jgi:hypothetical protein